MGGEILLPLMVVIGVILLLMLISHLFSKERRPYALPTLIMSILVSLPLAGLDHDPGLFFWYVLKWFPVAVVLLRLNFQVQRPHIRALPCPEPTTT